MFEWTKTYLYWKLESEYEATMNSMMNSIDPEKNMTNELIEEQLSTKPVHSRIIEAYSNVGLSFYELRGLKFRRDQFCHSVFSSTIPEQEQIQLDLQEECPIQQDDSLEIRNLRLSLKKLLEAITQIK